MNSEQQQQRIMGYFIEEAREHLQTIEQGVLNLQDVLHDSESVNELFRAAHSIKGGAAMLGVGSIQHVAHRLEDFFKILKENPQIDVDERLKSLLLAGFDPLAELLDDLQGSFRISDELTTETNNRVKPIFIELESYLNQLVSDSDGDKTTDTFVQTQKAIDDEPLEELVSSQDEVFQQDITTKMRDMLQLFRGEDSAESRSQLQVICNYFQEIGNTFNLSSWNSLVSQIKNAIAQPSNSYRTLAPILIRELKDAQDFVLSNREAEIAVSLQLQNLIPYLFSESQDDEVSTIFTTASGDIAKPQDAIVETLQIDDIAITEDDDIDLFGDQIGEEVFDLSDVRGEQIDQLDWIDSEYTTTENQHIDGPKVGASELKSLAILFENDEIDFDAAWEDIESNETNIVSHGINQISDSDDEFADLLGDTYDEGVTDNALGNEASSMDELFGVFSTDDLATEIVENAKDSLFPEDLEDSWMQSPENDKENEQVSLDENISNDLVGDDLTGDNNLLDADFGINLGADIISQINDEISIDDIDFSDSPQLSDSADFLTDQLVVDNQFISDSDTSESLSSEEYFAELERQENAIANEGQNEPFALTSDEQGIAFLNDPFAIDASLDEDLLEEPLEDVVEQSLDFSNNPSIGDDFPVFSDELESNLLAGVASNIASNNDLTSPNLTDENLLSAFGSPDNNSLDTSALNIFNELGFDSDEFDEMSDESQNVDIKSDSPMQPANTENDFVDFDVPEAVSVNEVSRVDDLSDFFADRSDDLDNLDNLDAEGIPEIFSAEITTPEIINNEQLADEFVTTDDLDDFFEPDNQLQDVNVESINYIPLDGEINISVESNGSNELDDFLAGSEIPDIINQVGEAIYEVTSSQDLVDFFSDSEESEVESNDFEQNLDVFAPEVDDEVSGLSLVEEIKADGFLEDVSYDDWSPLNNIDNNDNNIDIIDIEGNSGETSDSEFVDFGIPQQMSSDFIAVEEENNVNIAIENITEDITEEFLSKVNSPETSKLDDLFAESSENELTTFDDEINNEITNEFSFDEEQSLDNQDNGINNLAEIDFTDLDLTNIDDFLSSEPSNSSDDLTTIQADLDLDDSVITANSTIDSLVDFFQGDDDEPESDLPEASEEIVSDNLGVERSLDFGGLGESIDFNVDNSDISGFQFVDSQETQSTTIQAFASESRGQTEELNGIDDNFNFDDLEAMIGSSSPMTDGFQDADNSGLDNSLTESFVAEQQFVNSDDMNFDELEALLGDSGSFDASISNRVEARADAFTASIPTSPNKPTDDFDDLENMLQDAFSKDVGPIKTKAPIRSATTQRKQRLTDSTMRVDVKYLDSLNNLVGELVVNRNLLEQDQERLQQFITSLLHQVQLLSDVSQRMRDQYDRSLLEASLTAGRGRSSYSSFDASYSNIGGSSNSSASSDFEGIEFDRYNTFHVLSQEIIELIVKVRESASDIEFVVGETDQVTRQLGTITTQVQDDLKQSRMVPFAQIADRLPRGIRDRALKTGKQAELEIYGRETLIDKAILEQLTDPLTHLVNNAIDHGLEDPATRQKAGKSSTGKLTVRAYHQGNQTVISISDDGAGISTDKVKKSAVSKRVRTQSEVDLLNDTEVYALLFEAGFSTAAQADEFKGRGVGLDVVKTCLDEIRGVIIVESVVGKGTTFTIRLPLTLSISKAMFCISDRARIAFPVDGFEDMVEVPQNQIVLNEKGQPCLPWRDTLLPFQHLSNLLAYSRHLSRSSIYGKQENDELCIIILRNDTSYLALQVDQFLGEYEIVIKQLEGPIPQPAGIAGATVLGDGRVMAIANVLELFDIASGRLRPSTSSITIQPMVEEDIAADPTVLIVDDSITVRELLSLTFAKVGYRVEQAKDGQDAWEKLRAGLPCDMIFCDIEMPRMDGLDLLSRLQKDSRLKEIPVAMLTSRGADRHRQSAIQLGAKGYFTKPYLEEELLSASKRLLAGETLPI